MIDLQSITYLLLFTPIFLGYLIWHFGLREYFLDVLRQDLFNIRDELFNLALNSEISFDSDFYRELEGKVNLLIRYAHNFTFTNIIISDLAIRLKFYKVRNKTSSKLIEQIDDFDSLENHVKSKLTDLQENIYKTFIRRIIGYSPATILIVIVYLIRISFKDSNDTFSQRLKKFVLTGIGKDADLSQFQERQILHWG